VIFHNIAGTASWQINVFMLFTMQKMCLSGQSSNYHLIIDFCHYHVNKKCTQNHLLNKAEHICIKPTRLY